MLQLDGGLEVDDNHPIASELSSLRLAVARFQDEAHSSSVKLQRFSLAWANDRDRILQVERENDALKSELAILRANPRPDTAPQSHPAVLQVHELTLSLRRLSDKLSLTEDALLARTTELAHAVSEGSKARMVADNAYELAARARGREEAAKVREFELEWKIKAAEEAVKMSDLVVNEYADLVRSLEEKAGMRPITLSRSPSSSSPPGYHDETGTSSTDIGTTTPAQNLSQGKVGLQRLLAEFSAETEKLQIQIVRLHEEVSIAESKSKAESKVSEECRIELANARFELQKLQLDDNAAAKMVSRYMKFSQKSTDSLQDALTALKSRHAATTGTLASQLYELSTQLRSSEGEVEKLRTALDELAADILKETYGRRREVALRIRMVNREEKTRDEFERWLLRAEEALERDGDSSDTVHKMVQGGRELLFSMLDGPLVSPSTSSGSLGRIILARSAVEELTKELEFETARRLELESLLARDETIPVRETKKSPNPSTEEARIKSELLHPIESGTLLLAPSNEELAQLPVDTPPQVNLNTPLLSSASPTNNKSQTNGSVTELDAAISIVDPNGGQGKIQEIRPEPATPSSLFSYNEDTPTFPIYGHHTQHPAEAIEILMIDDVEPAESHDDNQDKVSGGNSDLLSPPDINENTNISLPLIVQIVIDTAIVDGSTSVSSTERPVDWQPIGSNLYSRTSTDGATGDQFPNLEPTAVPPGSDEPPRTPPSGRAVEEPTTRAVTPFSSPPVTQNSVPLDSLSTTRSDTTSSRKPHPLLADLVHVSHRYDDLQRAFRDCHLALEALKSSMSVSFAPSFSGGSRSNGMHSSEVLQIALERLNDYTEDARVELEIHIADEALMARGFETLLSVPGALSSPLISSPPLFTESEEGRESAPSQSEVERQVEAFISGSDPLVQKSLQSLSRKLDDVQHDIAALKRAAHENVLSPSLPSDMSTTNGGGWSSWMRSSPSLASSPASGSTLGSGPAPTFGSVMTTPRLRHSPSLNLQSSGKGYTGIGAKDVFASLGLKVPMPSYAHVPQTPQRSRTVSTMYMVGLGARKPSNSFTSTQKSRPPPPPKLNLAHDVETDGSSESGEDDTDVE